MNSFPFKIYRKMKKALPVNPSFSYERNVIHRWSFLAFIEVPTIKAA